MIRRLRSSFTKEGILKARAIEERLMNKTWLSSKSYLLPRLRELRTLRATLVIYGEADFIPAECAAHVAEAIPGARFALLKECGHFSYLECPITLLQAPIEEGTAMKVTTFQAICNACHTPFDNPLLPDMSYGEFIARGEKGTAFAYLPSIGNAGWDRIDQLFKRVFPKKHASSETKCFQWIIGKCLDPINDQELRIVGSPVCPNCHGNNVQYGDDVRTGELDLPDATFSKFLSRDDLAQEQMVKELCEQWLETSTKSSTR